MIKSLIIKHFQFIKFLLVGGLNTLFGYGVYSFFIYIGVHYSLATLFGTILGIFFNFFTTGRIVFKNSNNKLIIKFFIVYGISYLINLCGLKIFLTLGLNAYIAGLILVLPMAILIFILNKKFVFN